MSEIKTHICPECGLKMDLINVVEPEIEKNRHKKGAVFFKKGYDHYLCDCGHEVKVEHKRDKIQKTGKRVTEKLVVIIEGSEWTYENFKKMKNGSGAIFVLKRDGWYTYLAVTYNKKIIDFIEELEWQNFNYLAEVRESRSGVLELNFVEIL